MRTGTTTGYQVGRPARRFDKTGESAAEMGRGNPAPLVEGMWKWLIEGPLRAHLVPLIVHRLVVAGLGALVGILLDAGLLGGELAEALAAVLSAS